MMVIIIGVGMVFLVVLMVLIGVYLGLLLIGSIKETLVEFEWIHTKADKDDDDDYDLSL